MTARVFGRRLLVLLLFWLGVLSCVPVRAADALVAVATNFAEVANALLADFSTSGHTVRLVSGSTGKLYAQIKHGAPFDVFLAADTQRPQLLADQPEGVADSRFTYALGQLALWSRNPQLVQGEQTLRQAQFRRLALANPELAPYGAAALDTLNKLALLPQLQKRLVYGENVGQAYAMVATGNAELGFVALSYLAGPNADRGGSFWQVPAEYHRVIRQDAVLLRHGADNPAATAFVAFLRTPGARATVQRFGYGTL